MQTMVYYNYEELLVRAKKNTSRVAYIIIRTVVRIVGMGRMSHICNTKCSRL